MESRYFRLTAQARPARVESDLCGHVLWRIVSFCCPCWLTIKAAVPWAPQNVSSHQCAACISYLILFSIRIEDPGSHPLDPGSSVQCVHDGDYAIRSPTSESQQGSKILCGLSGTMNKDLGSANCVWHVWFTYLAVAYCNALDPQSPSV